MLDEHGDPVYDIVPGEHTQLIPWKAVFVSLVVALALTEFIALIRHEPKAATLEDRSYIAGAKSNVEIPRIVRKIPFDRQNIMLPHPVTTTPVHIDPEVPPVAVERTDTSPSSVATPTVTPAPPPEAAAPERRRRHEDEEDICTRHGLHKIWTKDRRSWRCR